MSLQLLEEAKDAHECIDWLHHCKAACCRTFGLALPNNINQRNVIKGHHLQLPVTNDEDLLYYLTLHGITVIKRESTHAIIDIKLNDFRIVGRELRINRTCDNLTKDYKCKVHGTDKKPQTCKDFNLATSRDPRYLLPADCLYRYK